MFIKILQTAESPLLNDDFETLFAYMDTVLGTLCLFPALCLQGSSLEPPEMQGGQKQSALSLDAVLKLTLYLRQQRTALRVIDSQVAF